jgi:hypothetical protein
LFQAYQTHGYLPFRKQATLVEVANRIAVRRETVDTFYDTKKGVVVLLRGGQVYAPFLGEYALFESAKEYRDAVKDRALWSAIQDKQSSLLGHLRFDGE